MTETEVLGNIEPRIYTKPLRKLTDITTLGFYCIEYATDVMCVKLDLWQQWAVIHALEIEGDLKTSWHFRFRTIIILVARQNGKTVLSEVITSFFLNVLKVKSVFGTSLSLDKAEEAWDAVVSNQQSIPELDAEIIKVSKTNGSKQIVLKGDTPTEKRIYKVGAPTRRAGRGDSNDLVLLDELREQRDWETWSAAVASTNAKPNGMVICFSNAGDPQSIVLNNVRAKCIMKIKGERTDQGQQIEDFDVDTTALFEWSSPEGAATDDLKALAEANPSLGYGRMTVRALLSTRATYPEAQFRAECMCQMVANILKEPFPVGSWDACVDPNSTIMPESELFYGVDLSEDRKWGSIAVCGLREDGNYHIEVAARRVGTEWMIDWFRARAMSRPMKVAFQSRGAPVSGLAEQICTINNIERCAIEGSDLTNGWSRFWDGIAASAPVVPGETPRGGVRIFHLPQPILDAPAKTCQLRNLGGGVEMPDRVKSPDDIAPLFACVMAYAAASAIKKDDGKIYKSSYMAGNDLLLI